jgi:hypothetical protein
MCLVELKNSPKPIVSCAMSAKSCLANGVIYTSLELKNIVSIDFSDGFGTPIQLSIKNNRVIKILPSYDTLTYRPHLIIICLNKSINLEVLNLSNILTQKYSFFKLRLSELQNLIADLEQNYLLASNLSTDKILKSNTCLLIGVNPRYEGSKLNLILRSRHLKGNFKVIQIGSLISLTFPNINITSNIKILKSLVEKNNLFCKK